jgi:hypothetical protein
VEDWKSLTVQEESRLTEISMAEDLTRLWRNFSLSAEEGNDLKIANQNLNGLAVRGKSCLIGKLIAERIVGKEFIRKTMIKGWRPKGFPSFKVLGDNLFLIEFEYEEDKSRVLKGRPWVCDGNLFSVEDFDGLTPPTEIPFDHAAFWVRMTSLPLACMGPEVGTQIGSSVGTVEEVETDEEGGGWGKFLRVRIKIDLTKPLARGRMINLQGKRLWIPFQYERLPRFCFHCGLICHGSDGCLKSGDANPMEAGQEYGTWLRVPPPHKRIVQRGSRFSAWGDDGKGDAPRYPNGRKRRDWGGRSVESRMSDGVGGASAMPTEENAEGADSEFPRGKEAGVMEEEQLNEAGENLGENQGIPTGLYDNSFPNFPNSQQLQKERNNEALNEEINEEENLLQSVRGLKLKGKEKLGINANCPADNRKSSVNFPKRDESFNGGKVTNKENGVTNKENGVSLGKESTYQDACHVNSNDVVNKDVREGAKGNINAELNTLPRVTQSWKRRARVAQQWPAEPTALEFRGKRKKNGDQEVVGENVGYRSERRVKYGEGDDFVLRDEEDEDKIGSGLAGSVSQTRRPT